VESPSQVSYRKETDGGRENPQTYRKIQCFTCPSHPFGLASGRLFGLAPKIDLLSEKKLCRVQCRAAANDHSTATR
jgi:hypothetical protein